VGDRRFVDAVASKFSRKPDAFKMLQQMMPTEFLFL
jgi:hypothetical protein